MPTSFFDLPRELRDMIYCEVLLSPTGYVGAIAIKAKGKVLEYTPSRFTLTISLPTSMNECNPHPKHTISSSSSSLSLSLMRTNRQIRRETAGLFWTRNTFSFHRPFELIHTLKDMGQTPSRLITSITLTLAFPSAFDTSHPLFKTLPKVLRLLASRARRGAFRRLRFHLAAQEFRRLARRGTSARPADVDAYDAFLGVLRAGAECGFEKVVAVRMGPGAWRVWGCKEHDTLRDLHLAWGGMVTCNDEAEWVDFVHVGNCAERLPAAAHLD
jgi:hypothetical protein